MLTDDRPADHPWQHGIFTGFHKVNGVNYWLEDQGRQRFVRLLDLKEDADRVSWRSLVELVAPDGQVVLEEEQTVTVYAPTSVDGYRIDFDLLLRAKNRDVTFGKFQVGGLAVRMPWDKARPLHTHLSSTGAKRRAETDQKRAKWCTVERPFGATIFGIAVFDHPDNPNHPATWRVDQQGLINPALSYSGDWSLKAGTERVYRYGIFIYQGSGQAEALDRRYKAFAATAGLVGTRENPKK